MTSLVIPNSIENIESRAFAGCTALASLTIGEGVKTIGAQAFLNCTGLKELIYNAVECTNTNYAFAMSGISSIVVGDRVKSVPDNAFMNCTQLSTITMGDSVENIGAAAFSGCSSLTSIDIPEYVVNIGASAFSGCIGLTSMDIPKYVVSIGDGAFSNCTGLQEMTIRATTPPNILAYTFFYVDKSMPVYVPAGSMDDYKSAVYWEEFINYQPLDGGEETGVLSLALSESIVIAGGEVVLTNVKDMTEVQVYNMDGHLVLCTTETRFTLPQGIYVLRVGGEVAKIVVQ